MNASLFFGQSAANMRLPPCIVDSKPYVITGFTHTPARARQDRLGYARVSLACHRQRFCAILTYTTTLWRARQLSGVHWARSLHGNLASSEADRMLDMIEGTMPDRMPGKKSDRLLGGFLMIFSIKYGAVSSGNRLRGLLENFQNYFDDFPKCKNCPF